MTSTSQATATAPPPRQEPQRAPQRKGRPQHHWEDLRVGDELEAPGITVTEAHLVSWAGLTGDLVSLHLDESYAQQTPFGRRIAHGPLTLSLALGLMTQTGYFTHVVAWLGLDAVRATSPVFIGDSLLITATVIEARPTSHPERGLWALEYLVTKHDGTRVMTFESRFLIARTPTEGNAP